MTEYKYECRYERYETYPTMMKRWKNWNWRNGNWTKMTGILQIDSTCSSSGSPGDGRESEAASEASLAISLSTTQQCSNNYKSLQRSPCKTTSSTSSASTTSSSSPNSSSTSLFFVVVALLKTSFGKYTHYSLRWRLVLYQKRFTPFIMSNGKYI